jgi:hypothetical protein
MISRDRERGVRHGELAPGVAIVQKGLRPFSDLCSNHIPDLGGANQRDIACIAAIHFTYMYNGQLSVQFSSVQFRLTVEEPLKSGRCEKTQQCDFVVSRSSLARSASSLDFAIDSLCSPAAALHVQVSNQVSNDYCT